MPVSHAQWAATNESTSQSKRQFVSLSAQNAFWSPNVLFNSSSQSEVQVPEGPALGEAEGHEDGEAEGHEDGEAEGLDDGEAEGVEDGEAEGLEDDEAEGPEDGEAEGHEDGEAEGHEEGAAHITVGFGDGAL